MSAVLIGVLALVALGCALYPLFREERYANPPERRTDLRLEHLLSAREATYSAIKDLEFDHVQGKLSDVDYQTTRAKYENKALLILQELNLLELRAAYAKPAASPTCTQCGEPYRPADKFCRRCGASLGPAQFAGCVNCGTAIQAEWKFCKKCGAPLGVLETA